MAVARRQRYGKSSNEPTPIACTAATCLHAATATVFARRAHFIRSGRDKSASDRRLADAEADTAMSWLKEAVRTGYKDTRRRSGKTGSRFPSRPRDFKNCSPTWIKQSRVRNRSRESAALRVSSDVILGFSGRGTSTDPWRSRPKTGGGTFVAMSVIRAAGSGKLTREAAGTVATDSSSKTMSQAAGAVLTAKSRRCVRWSDTDATLLLSLFRESQPFSEIAIKRPIYGGRRSPPRVFVRFQMAPLPVFC